MGTTPYHAIVIGAGPAGCMAALALARRGARTLVVDKGSRGRWKVCGCCLGALGQQALRDARLHQLLNQAAPLDALTLVARGTSVVMPLRGFVSLARETLDAGLADAAAEAGAHFRWGARAQWQSSGSVELDDGSAFTPGVVVDASGLRGQRQEDARVAGRARIGLGLTTASTTCQPGTLTMAVAKGGYLGRVALPDGRVDFAAAVLPSFVRARGTPAAALRAIWSEAGLDPADVPDGPWRGTPALSRSRQPQDGRVLRVGDAAGYVEPFTGEGMSWAMHAAAHVADDALACIEHGPDASRWPKTLYGLLATRHTRCRAVVHAVRSPRLVSAGLRVASLFPAVGALGAARLSGAARGMA
jgi:flavin-dependent dehydrogenase